MSQTTSNRAPARNANELREIAWHLSRDIIESTTLAGSGHPSSSLSAIDILTVLYFGGMMRYDPVKPDWPDRDRFIMSKGHASPGLYVTLAKAGYFDHSLLSTLRKYGSSLEGHPVMGKVPGVEASTGSLGQGLSIGLGYALAGRLDRRDYRVYVMIGDGESDEGQIWEAAMSAAKYQVDHLTCILDFNRYQQTGPMSEVMPSLMPVTKKWEAFGWAVYEIDGHDQQQILNTFTHTQLIKGQPQIIIAHTDKGRGLSAFQADEQTRKHGAALSGEDARSALAELDEQYQAAQHGDGTGASHGNR